MELKKGRYTSATVALTQKVLEGAGSGPQENPGHSPLAPNCRMTPDIVQ